MSCRLFHGFSPLFNEPLTTLQSFSWLPAQGISIVQKSKLRISADLCCGVKCSRNVLNSWIAGLLGITCVAFDNSREYYCELNWWIARAHGETRNTLHSLSHSTVTRLNFIPSAAVCPYINFNQNTKGNGERKFDGAMPTYSANLILTHICFVI